jgi:hypothetical protein
LSNNYVQYGCGFSAPDKWVNFDASPTLRLEQLPVLGHLLTRRSSHKKSRFPKNVKYGNIIKGLPLKKESASLVYCSHVLEHLSLNDCRKSIQNTYDLLKKGGTFRLVMPDLERLIQDYVKSDSDNAAINFMDESLLGLKQRNYTVSRFLIDFFGGSNHLWLWDFKSFKKELESVGFSNVRRANFRDNNDPMLNDVEEISRWDGHLGIECVKT